MLSLVDREPVFVERPVNEIIDEQVQPQPGRDAKSSGQAIDDGFALVEKNVSAWAFVWP